MTLAKYQHKGDFADYIHDYLIDVHGCRNFSINRIYQSYDALQIEIKDGEEVIVLRGRKNEPVVKIIKNGDEALIKFKAGKSWFDIGIMFCRIKGDNEQKS